MILLVDIGNTFTKIALGKSTVTSLTLIKEIASDERNWLTIIEKKLKVHKNKIENIIISSVVPSKLKAITNLIFTIFNFKPLILNAKLINFFPLSNHLNPNQIGSDLLALAVASDFMFGNTITISLGTATAYIILEHGNLKGTIIAPGFHTAKESLAQQAALIKPFTITPYPSLLGQTTNHALSIGYGNGFNYMIKSTVEAVEKELKTPLKVILTGGNFSELKPFLKFNYHYEPNLVLKGLLIIYHILKKNNKLN